MAILVPGVGFKLGDGGLWEILPPPLGVPIGNTLPRQGIYLNIYETINPATIITATGNIACPGGTPGPIQPSPELITGISIEPGQGQGKTGKGVSVLLGAVRNIPEMLFPVFSEPFVTYNKIVSPPVPTLALAAPLGGYISEKYLHDMDFAVSTLYQTPSILATKDRLKSTSYELKRRERKRPFPERPIKKTDLGIVTGDTTLQSYTPKVPAVGPVAHSVTAANSSYVYNYRPSLIRRLRFFYTIIVTSTCPPFNWYFPAYMDVDNNWTNHRTRVVYRINRQKGVRRP